VLDKIVYVAGALRGNFIRKWLNFKKIHKICKKLWSNNIINYSPHKNSGWFDNKKTDEFMLASNIELLKRCDILFVVDNWKKSSGTMGELIEAIRSGKKIYFDIDDLIEDLKYRRFDRSLTIIEQEELLIKIRKIKNHRNIY